MSEQSAHEVTENRRPRYEPFGWLADRFSANQLELAAPDPGP